MSPAWRPLAQLLCGAYRRHGALGDVLTVIGSAIDNACERLAEIGALDADHKRVAAAFYSRSLLEAACSAMIARSDPFRVLVIQNVQKQKGYRLDVRSKSAIEWAGDVMSKGAAPNPTWSEDYPFEKYDRSLFGDYYGLVFWAPAHGEVVDDPLVQAEKGSDWLTELVGWSGAQFHRDNRTTAGRLFSSLSKGVHQEFVVGLSANYDEPTVTQLVLDTVKFCAFLGLVSHKLLPGVSCLGSTEALDLFKRTEGERYGT